LNIDSFISGNPIHYYLKFGFNQGNELIEYNSKEDAMQEHLEIIDALERNETIFYLQGSKLSYMRNGNLLIKKEEVKNDSI